MGTKNNSSQYDCYEKANPDEQMFILLGRDRHASALVKLWANLREMEGESVEVVEEARACAELLEQDARSRGKPVLSYEALVSYMMSVNKPVKKEEEKPVLHKQEKDLDVGDYVITSYGKVVGVINKIIVAERESLPTLKLANISFGRNSNPVTVEYHMLRKPTSEEMKDSGF
jgi:hypothetical protein